MLKRTFIFFLFVVMFFALKAQDIHQVIQLGHSENITGLQAIPEYNLVLSYDENKAILWEFNSGRKINDFSIQSGSNMKLVEAVAIPKKNLFIVNIEHFESGAYYSTLEWYKLVDYEFIGSLKLITKIDDVLYNELVTDMALFEDNNKLYCVFEGGYQIINVDDRNTLNHKSLPLLNHPRLAVSGSKVVMYSTMSEKLFIDWSDPSDDRWFGSMELPGITVKRLAISPDYKWFVVGVDSGKVLLINPGKEKAMKTFYTDSVTGDITYLMFTTDSKYIIVKNEKTGGIILDSENSGVRKINIVNGDQFDFKIEDEIYNKTNFEPIRNKNQFIACSGNYFNLYNEQDAFLLKSYKTYINPVLYMNCDAAGNNLFIDNTILNTNNLKTTLTSGYFSQFAFDPVSVNYFVVNDSGNIAETKMNGLEVIKEYKNPGLEGISDISASNDGKWLSASYNYSGEVYIWRRDSDNYFQKFYNSDSLRISHIRFTPDSKYLIIVRDRKFIELLLMDSLKVVLKFGQSNDYESIGQSIGYDVSNSTFAFTSGYRQVSFFNLKKDSFIYTQILDPENWGLYKEIIFNSQTSHWILLNSRGIIEILDTGFHLLSQKDFGGDIYTFCLDTAHHKIYLSHNDGSVSCWQYGVEDTQIVFQYQIISVNKENKNDLVFRTGRPKYYYFAPKAAVAAFHYVEGLHTFPYDQFDFALNQPAEVLKAMKSLDSGLIKVYQKAFAKTQCNNGKFTGFAPRFSNFFERREEIPVLRILNSNDIPPVTSKRSIAFDLGLTLPNNSKSNEFNYTINRVPVKWDEAEDLNEYDSLGRYESARRFVFSLSEGKNTFRFKITDTSGLESFTQSLDIIYRPEKPLSRKVYFIGIAVSDYKDKTMNLKYAAKDIRDLSKLFREKATRNKTEISIDTFINSNATLENIRKIRYKLINSNIDDIIILSVSGHGLLDDSLNFYYATYDCDFKDPHRRGMKYEELEKLMNDVPARNRLLLVDACHSGEIDRQEQRNQYLQNDKDTIHNYAAKGSQLLMDSTIGLDNSFELMRLMFDDFSKDDGTQVISASAGNEYALESDSWHNGVFTYCLIKGLSDPLTDTNKDNKISVNELKRYISIHVVELTQGKQNPTSRKENPENNWIIW